MSVFIWSLWVDYPYLHTDLCTFLMYPCGFESCPFCCPSTVESPNWNKFFLPYPVISRNNELDQNQRDLSKTSWWTLTALSHSFWELPQTSERATSVSVITPPYFLTVRVHATWPKGFENLKFAPWSLTCSLSLLFFHSCDSLSSVNLWNEDRKKYFLFRVLDIITFFLFTKQFSPWSSSY